MPTIIGHTSAQSLDFETEVGGKHTRRFTDVYVVEAETEAVTEAAVGITPGLPITGFTYWSRGSDVDPDAICRRKRVERVEGSRTHWRVTCEFDTSTIQTPDPKQTEYRWDYETIPVVVDRDIYNRPITNSVGEPFDPPVTVERPIPVLTITRYETAFVPAIAYSYVNTVNNAPFYGAAAEKALISGIRASIVNDTFIPVWRVEYTIKFNYFTWRAILLDQGTRYLDGNDIKLCRDAELNPTLCNLDGQGGKLDPGQYWFLWYRIYPFSNFNTLALV